MSAIDSEIPRIRALLAVQRDPDVVESDPFTPPDSVGAVDGVGYSWDNEQARVEVFLFDNYYGANDAMKSLSEKAAAEPVVVSTTVNGSLLLWATAPEDDPAALARIEDLAGSFAGEE